MSRISLCNPCWFLATPALEYRTGYWNITDPQHPDYINLRAADLLDTDKEIIAEGTHYIATLQESQLLEQTEPILPTIEAAATAGLSIPTDIPPIALTSHAPPMSGT